MSNRNRVEIELIPHPSENNGSDVPIKRVIVDETEQDGTIFTMVFNGTALPQFGGHRVSIISAFAGFLGFDSATAYIKLTGDPETIQPRVKKQHQEILVVKRDSNKQSGCPDHDFPFTTQGSRLRVNFIDED